MLLLNRRCDDPLTASADASYTTFRDTILWQQLFPAEQCRLAQLLIERVVIGDNGLEIIWRDHGWQELAGEPMPGTIGAELQEWEQQEVEA